MNALKDDLLYNEFITFYNVILNIKNQIPKLKKASADDYSVYFITNSNILSSNETYNTLKWPAYFYNFLGSMCEYNLINNYEKGCIKNIFHTLYTLIDKNIPIDDDLEKTILKTAGPTTTKKHEKFIVFNVYRLYLDTKLYCDYHNISDLNVGFKEKNDFMNNWLLNYYKEYSNNNTIVGGKKEYDIPSMLDFNIGIDKNNVGSIAEYDELHLKYPSVGHLLGDLQLFGNKTTDNINVNILQTMSVIDNQFGKITLQIINPKGLILFWVLNDIIGHGIILDMRPLKLEYKKNIDTIIIKSAVNYNKYTSNHIIQKFSKLNNKYITSGLISNNSLTLFNDSNNRTCRRPIVYKFDKNIQLYKPMIILDLKYIQLPFEQRTEMLNDFLIKICVTRGEYLKYIYTSLSKHINWDKSNITNHLEHDDLILIYKSIKHLAKKIEFPITKTPTDIIKTFNYIEAIINNILNDLNYYIPDIEKVTEDVCLNNNYISRSIRAQEISQFLLLNMYEITTNINTVIADKNN